MRRFRRTGFSRKAPREPTTWVRSFSAAHAVDILSTPTAVTLFDPTSEVAGTVDELLTIRRTMVDASLDLNATSAAAFVIGDVVRVNLGIATVETSGKLPDPSLPTSFDERYDWMWLGSVNFTIASAATTLRGGVISERNLQNQPALIDLGRIMRKIHQDETLKLIASGTFNGTVSFLNTFTVLQLSYQLNSSILFSRTMKRR